MRTLWEEFFSKIRYKPNVTVVYDNRIHFERESITITMYVPDSRDLRNLLENQTPTYGLARHIPLVPITASYVLDHWINEEYAKHYIRDLLRRMEDHEIDEWLRYNGELINDPHEGEQK